jgi:hypothetical protein
MKPAKSYLKTVSRLDSRRRSLLMRDVMWDLINEAASKSGVSANRYMRDLIVEALESEGLVS